MSRYNIRDMVVVEVNGKKMWQIALANGKKIRAIGKTVFEYSNTAKKYKAIQNNAVISSNRISAYKTIERMIGKIQIVNKVNGQVKMAERETGKRGRKNLSVYGL